MLIAAAKVTASGGGVFLSRRIARVAPHLFAGIPVSDYAAARPWYERLLGAEPTMLPHDTEAV